MKDKKVSNRDIKKIQGVLVFAYVLSVAIMVVTLGVFCLLTYWGIHTAISEMIPKFALNSSNPTAAKVIAFAMVSYALYLSRKGVIKTLVNYWSMVMSVKDINNDLKS